MTFRSFLAQYDAVPPVKLDGYDASQFVGMSAKEREEARDMMLKRGLTRGDTTDLDGLKLVGDDIVVERLSNANNLTEQFGEDVDIARLESLFVLTANYEILERLLVYVDSRKGSVQRLAATSLCRLKLPKGMSVEMSTRLAGGLHETIKVQLVQAWLSSTGAPVHTMKEFQKRLPFIRWITSARPQDRLYLLDLAATTRDD